MRWSAESLALACGGVLERRSERPIAAAFIDTRTPRAEALFVPIVAARDGHHFLDDAVAGGASAVLCGEGHAAPAGDVSVVRVGDTLEALTALARDARRQLRGPAVAITGSNGKTTTRALTQAVLAAHYDPVLCTRGNLNNHLGVPLTLLDEPHEPAAMVVELGMSAPGENDHLARIVAPTVGIVTSVALEHLEFMGSIEAIADAELEVAAHVAPEGALVVPSDEPLIASRIPAGYRPRVMRVGPCDDAEVSIREVEVAADAAGRTRVRLRLPGGDTLELWLALFGAHNARNAASAVAAGLALGVPVERMAAALATVAPVGDRGRVEALGPHLLIADCYNANPGSMEAALGSLGALGGRGRRLVAVLGDMLELGPTELELHREVGAFAAAQGVTYVVGVGRLAEHIVAGARDAGAEGHFVGDDPDAAATLVAGLLDAGPAAALFKASRGVALERVLERVRAGGGG